MKDHLKNYDIMNASITKNGQLKKQIHKAMTSLNLSEINHISRSLDKKSKIPLTVRASN